MISRTLEPQLIGHLGKGKVIIVVGPRQAGKTTLIRTMLNEQHKKTLFLDGDDPTVQQLLSTPNTEQLRQLISGYATIFVDEAQRIAGIGLTAKIINDQFGDCQLILSGSSSFSLLSETEEPLTGRKFNFTLYPISWQEWQNHVGFLKSEQGLENRLVFGFYPDVINHPKDQERILSELTESYLYKDVLSYAGIRKPEIIEKLVRALAYQVGQEVVYSELSQTVGVDQKTIATYIDILEKAFVVFRLSAFSGNLRNEIKTTRKVYFYDNGIRNAVIGVFDSVAARQDVGALWENFIVSERVKKLSYNGSRARSYFWRTKQQQEIDYVEVLKQKHLAVEIKWNSGKSVRFPKTFTSNYTAETCVVSRENFREFLTEGQ